MAVERLSRLQRRILCTIYEAEASSGWRISPSHLDLKRAVGGNKGTFSLSLQNLEAKGLIEVYRTSGGRAESVWLTSEGKTRVSIFNEVWIKEKKHKKQ